MGDSPARLRPYICSWENEDKYSVTNTQARPQTGEDEHPERSTWSGKFGSLVSLFGYSVALGNIWRFPYLCYANGGGAFLIPFTVMFIIAGLPLMFMELSLGQYVSLGPVGVYKRFCPLLRGLGYGMILVSSIVMLYYNLVIAWALLYMLATVIGGSELPWKRCEPLWSMESCFMPEGTKLCMARNMSYFKARCLNGTQMASLTLADIINATRRSPAEEYFINHVLALSSGVEETSSVMPLMAVSFLFAWIIVSLCLSKDVQSSGKVVYFTALFPYVILIALFIRGIFLPGAKEGILFYLTPDWERLRAARVWGDAAVQVLFALSPSWGGLITFSSYNKFNNNCYRDSLIVAVSNISTSFFAGLVISSVIGFLAHELSVPIATVVDGGVELALIVYSEVVAGLPVAPLWSLLFFLMLLTLGLDSQFALMETVTTAILDAFPTLRRYKFWIVLSIAVMGYAGGIIFTTNSGMYWLQLMNEYAANWSVLLIAITECILVGWVYGAERFLNDIQQMIGVRSCRWRLFWSWTWKIVTPAALFFTLYFNWVEHESLKYDAHVYPMWANIVGWIIGLLPVIIIVGLAVYQLLMLLRQPKSDDDQDTDKVENVECCRQVGRTKLGENVSDSIWNRAKILLQPTCDWGPASSNSIELSRTFSDTPSSAPQAGQAEVLSMMTL